MISRGFILLSTFPVMLWQYWYLAIAFISLTFKSAATVKPQVQEMYTQYVNTGITYG